jgi:hypothetical protein
MIGGITPVRLAETNLLCKAIGMSDENSEAADRYESAGTSDPGEAAGLLDETRRLRRDARSARHAYWLPLLLFSLLTFAAVPLYVPPNIPETSAGVLQVAGGSSVPLLSGAPGFGVQNYLGNYWLVALFGGLAITLLWYRRHARRVGLRTPSSGFVITIAVLTGLALILPLLAQIPGLRFLLMPLPNDLTIRGTVPFLIIAAGLCVLAWAERSIGLAVIAAVYTGTALLASLYDIENVLYRLGWNVSPGVPNVLLPAIVLLIAGAIAFAALRRQRSAA